MKRICSKPVVLGILLAAAIAATSCKSGKDDADKDAAAASTVRVHRIVRADISEILTYTADLKPYAEVRIFSPLPDRILSFPWEDGQTISRGQRVALIRKEGLDKGLEGIVAQADGLDIQIRNLESELARSKELLAAGVITRQTFDQVQTSYDSARAQRRALEANRAQMAVSAGNAVITAPISGVIAGKSLQTGDMASPQLPLCRIISIDKLKVELKLVESDVSKVRLGHDVILHLDAFPDATFAGRVTSIMPFLDSATRTNTVEVTVDNPKAPENGHRALKPGMFGHAELVLDMRAQVITAPEPALLLDNRVLSQAKGGAVLRKAFVIDADNIARERTVKLGARSGSLYEVVSGLAEGERVVVRGQHGLKEGDRVEIVTAENGSAASADSPAPPAPPAPTEAAAPAAPSEPNE